MGGREEVSCNAVSAFRVSSVISISIGCEAGSSGGVIGIGVCLSKVFCSSYVFEDSVSCKAVARSGLALKSAHWFTA